MFGLLLVVWLIEDVGQFHPLQDAGRVFSCCLSFGNDVIPEIGQIWRGVDFALRCEQEYQNTIYCDCLFQVRTHRITRTPHYK